MCGIFGYIGPDEAGLLGRMGAALVHRGPDDDGFFSDGRVHLGMRRLSIIDVAGGKQPVFSEDGQVVVIYNGETYNFRQLTLELQALGHRFATHSDSEVVAHAYEEWGEDCLLRLHGMFAFALYDRRRSVLLLARDRVGMKPLYLAEPDGQLIFASEVKGLLQSTRVPRRVNTSWLDAYLALRYVPQPETLFEGIRVLPAGHAMRVDLERGESHTWRYWQPTLTNGPYRSDGEYLDAFDAAFRGAVSSHLMSEVPVGAYLSGGVDSSAIVAVMSQLTHPVRTFSIGFGAPSDETAQARALAEHLGTDHHEIQCRPEHFELLPKMLYHLERPIGDALILAYYLLAQETAKHIKVVLAGEGADELFAGYSFHKVIQWVERYSKLIPEGVDRHLVVPAIRRAPVDLLDRFFVFPAYLGDEGRAKVADFLAGYRHRGPYGNSLALRTLFGPAERAALYSRDFAQAQADYEARPGRLDLPPSDGPFLDRLLAMQFEDWLPDFALLRQDKSSMAHSLELRLPFLDADLVDLAFQMPPHLKLRGLTDKYIERKWAERILPPENTRRSKNPFYLPVEFFFRHPYLRDLIADCLSPASVLRRGYFDPAAVTRLAARMESREFVIIKQVMALVILELWHRIFIDGERI